ncbi:MAG: ParB/RepB/Spo0J family partition protein [Candidatus Brocadiae bacterium]|nr:ParB/RepB/Spo0J family partition protein [Candidatus Brocadiia bacterium]
MKGKKLGKGLDYLLGEALGAPTEPAPVSAAAGTLEIPADKVKPNPFQPRKVWDKAEIDELAASIREQGLIQPIVVRKVGEAYQIVAGERRFRASQQLGRTSIPAVVRDFDDKAMLEVALVENLQRKDLNPIEKGQAFKALIDRFKLTHDAVSTRLGMDRSSVTNYLRLLDLPEVIREAVSRGTISMGHARCLVSLASVGEQLVLAKKIEKEGMSVRKLEKIVQDIRTPKLPKTAAESGVSTAVLKDQEEKLRRHFETKVKIKMGKGRGAVIVEFYNLDDFERIVGKMGL